MSTYNLGICHDGIANRLAMDEEDGAFQVKLKLPWQRIGTHALPLPRQAKHGDAGYDLACPYDLSLYPGDRVTVDTGWAVAIPYGWVGRISDRSGHANNFGLTVLGGTVDSGYRGEVKMILLNTGNERIAIPAGRAITQMVVTPCLHAEPVEVEDLDETERGANGFGHTG